MSEPAQNKLLAKMKRQAHIIMLMNDIKSKVERKHRTSELTSTFQQLTTTPNLILDNVVFQRQKTFTTFLQQKKPELTQKDLVGIKAIARPIKQCEQLHDIKNLALAHEKADIYFKRFKEDQYFYSHHLWGQKYYMRAMATTGLRGVGQTIDNYVNHNHTEQARSRFSSYLQRKMKKEMAMYQDGHQELCQRLRTANSPEASSPQSPQKPPIQEQASNLMLMIQNMTKGPVKGGRSVKFSGYLTKQIEEQDLVGTAASAGRKLMTSTSVTQMDTIRSDTASMQSSSTIRFKRISSNVDSDRLKSLQEASKEALHQNRQVMKDIQMMRQQELAKRQEKQQRAEDQAFMERTRVSLVKRKLVQPAVKRKRKTRQQITDILDD